MASCVNRQAKRNGLIVASSRARAAFSHGVTACTIAFLGISFGVKALEPNVENDRKVQEYVIDPQIWSPAVDIRWPNPESKTVVVYYSADEVVEKFGLHREADLREKLSEPQIRIGEISGNLIVMVSDEGLLHDAIRVFVSVHEAFHLAAQYYGAKVGVNKLSPFPEIEHEHQVNELWSYIEHQSRSARISGGSVDCVGIMDRFSSLSEIDRAYVLHRSYWEWPAEYYARVYSFGYQDGDGYQAARRMIPGDHYEYTSGSEALLYVNRIKGDDSWQMEISDGASSLDVFMDAAGCGHLDRKMVRVRISRIGFLD